MISSVIYSYLTIMIKTEPCTDGTFYRDKTSIPKLINRCTDFSVNMYDPQSDLRESFTENFFNGKYQVRKLEV